jgi:hypothetical protein
MKIPNGKSKQYKQKENRGKINESRQYFGQTVVSTKQHYSAKQCRRRCVYSAYVRVVIL